MTTRFGSDNDRGVAVVPELVSGADGLWPDRLPAPQSGCCMLDIIPVTFELLALFQKPLAAALWGVLQGRRRRLR